METLLAKLDEIDAKNKCGLLSEMMSAQLNVEDLKRIVIDLILAAGDTVSLCKSKFGNCDQFTLTKVTPAHNWE